MKFKVGDKVVLTEKGRSASSINPEVPHTISNVSGTLWPYRLNGDHGLFVEDELEFAPASNEGVADPNVAARQTYVDVVHFDALLKIQKAFEQFNASLEDNGSHIYLEATEIVVLDETGEKFATARYYDGEVLVEAHFDLIRDIKDR